MASSGEVHAEQVDEVRITPRGLEGDRRYGVLDRATGTIMSAKRWGELLQARALQTGPELVVCLPNGETVLGLGAGSDAALSSWLGRPVHLQEATEHTVGTNSLNTPTEALERAFPLRVLRYRLRRGSGGGGLAAGGEGIERDVQVLEGCTVSLVTERRVSAPWGLAGGEPGSPGENLLLPGGDETRVERLPDKCTFQLRAGDVLRMLTPGGGGWGSISKGQGQ